MLPTQGLVLAAACDVGICSGGKRLNNDTARMAARLRSVLHDSHASRTRSDGEMSLITVADPASRSYSRRAALMSSSVRCRISSQSARSITLSE